MKEFESHLEPERLIKFESPPPNKEGIPISINQEALQGILAELGIGSEKFNLIYVQGGGFSLLNAAGEKYKIYLRAEVNLPVNTYCFQLTHDLCHELYHIYEDPIRYPPPGLLEKLDINRASDSKQAMVEFKEALETIENLGLEHLIYNDPLFSEAEWYADSKCKTLEAQPAPIFQISCPNEVSTEPEPEKEIIFVNKTSFRYRVNWKEIRRFLECFPKDHTLKVTVILVPTEKFADYFYDPVQRRWVVCIPTISPSDWTPPHQVASVQLLRVFLQIKFFQLHPESVADYKFWRKNRVEAENTTLEYQACLLSRKVPSLLYLR